VHGWFNQAICLPQTHSDPPQGPRTAESTCLREGRVKGALEKKANDAKKLQVADGVPEP